MPPPLSQNHENGIQQFDVFRYCVHHQPLAYELVFLHRINLTRTNCPIYQKESCYKTEEHAEDVVYHHNLERKNIKQKKLTLSLLIYLHKITGENTVLQKFLNLFETELPYAPGWLSVLTQRSRKHFIFRKLFLKTLLLVSHGPVNLIRFRGNIKTAIF